MTRGYRLQVTGKVILLRRGIHDPTKLRGYGLVDDENLAGQATFDRLAIGQANCLIGYVNVAMEKTIVFLSRYLENFRADAIDADTARHVDRSAEHESIQRAVCSRRAGTAADWISIQYTTGQSERTAVVYIVEALEHEVYLWQYLVIYPLHELLGRHFIDRAEMAVAHRADHRVDLAGLAVHCANAVDILDIRLYITASAADFDDFVTRCERVHRGLPDCASGTNNDDFHGLLPRKKLRYVNPFGNLARSCL